MAQNPPENSFGVTMPPFVAKAFLMLETCKITTGDSQYTLIWKAHYTSPLFIGHVVVETRSDEPVMVGMKQAMLILVIGFGMRQPYYITWDELAKLEEEAIRTADGKYVRRGVIDIQAFDISDVITPPQHPEQSVESFMIAMMKVRESSNG